MSISSGFMFVVTLSDVPETSPENALTSTLQTTTLVPEMKKSASWSESVGQFEAVYPQNYLAVRKT